MATPAQPYYPQVDKSVDPKVTVHIQRIYPWLNNNDKAIVLLKQQLTALSKTVTTTAAAAATTSSSSSSGGGTTTNNFPGLGTDNDQTGATAYTVQQSDSGALIVVDDASPVAISLNSVIMSPFFCWISNTGTSTATLTPTTGTVNGAGSFALLSNNTTVVVFSGGNWYASAIPIAPLSAVSGSLGGSPMTAGQTITVAVTVAGAAVGMVATTSPEIYPGDSFVWDAYISAANTVTVRLTAVLAGTPVGSLYDVRVIQ